MAEKTALSRYEFITLVRARLQEDVSNVKEAVLACHGHGFADDETGDVESPVGHVIRANRWIVLTNSQGFTTLEEFDSEEIAQARFASYADAHADYLDDETTYMVRRFYANEQHPDHRKVIDTGLTLAEAQAHCQRDDTSGDGWFDGYDKEA